ncbi:MAG TPA: tRNA (N(6)-L-threonylcarbamoyladenosine(37)-C(2))-methylthiotransferase MtaB [Bacteroidetes bacterium]|jgi:threonylcarbamoyladenosine tRNA methylthiotransferase MtaB|nr:MAG: 2-methylthioadenine synthetase [Sphingobacteriales bacterium BACL12 MAG-120813-bin55]HCK21239.1 tRNA (N(6)-L-threonylcarbamoyladenosine(37)-C(2))-methylthiotransferase MtaB [Bacteroidota bacterium]
MAGTAAFYTLGCKLNFSESSALARQMGEEGFTIVPFTQGPDVYVINTCSVTDNADKKCRRVVKQALRIRPDARVVVIGCYAQLKPQEILSIPGVDLVLGAAEKFELPRHIAELKKTDSPRAVAGDIKDVHQFLAAYSGNDRTRTFLKVQDGCDYNCAFCTIPLARGKSRSNTVASVVEQAEKIAAEGVKEVVLTGVNIGDFGRIENIPRAEQESFLDLVKALDKVTAIERFRISSIEPNLLTKEIIETVAQSERFVPHFHIPLQSGSDKILAKMRRRYKRQLYADNVQLIRERMPYACIGVDVITGFPGESHADFLDTYHFLNELEVSYLHVFTYSERPNTLAIEMDNPVPVKEREERTAQLISLSEKKKRDFYTAFVGSKRPVLFEAETDGETMFGFTDNYIKVAAPYDPLLVNEIAMVELSAILPATVMQAGEIIVPSESTITL